MNKKKTIKYLTGNCTKEPRTLRRKFARSPWILKISLLLGVLSKGRHCTGKKKGVEAMERDGGGGGGGACTRRQCATPGAGH